MCYLVTSMILAVFGEGNTLKLWKKKTRLLPDGDHHLKMQQTLFDVLEVDANVLVSVFALLFMPETQNVHQLVYDVELAQTTLRSDQRDDHTSSQSTNALVAPFSGPTSSVKKNEWSKTVGHYK